MQWKWPNTLCSLLDMFIFIMKYICSCNLSYNIWCNIIEESLCNYFTPPQKENSSTLLIKKSQGLEYVLEIQILNIAYPQIPQVYVEVRMGHCTTLLQFGLVVLYPSYI